MSKYEASIFPNGRVILIESDTVEKAFQQDKEVLIVCTATSDGYAKVIGSDDGFDPDIFGASRLDYQDYLKDTSLNSEELQWFYKAIFSSGNKIYMKTGHEATAYMYGVFTDFNTNEKEIKNAYPSLTKEEIIKLRQTVDERKTVRFLPREDIEEKVQALINVGILTENAKQYI